MVPDRGPATFAVTLAVTVIATVFVVARFATRIWLVKSVKQDDWWILAAWICAVGFSASICVAVGYGLGKHTNDINDASLVPLRKAEYAFSVLYNPCLMLTKTSIIAFYLSVMSKDVDPVFKWCNWICLTVVNVAGLALTFLNIFQCTPVGAGYRYPTPDGARCTDIVTLYLSSAPVNIITDIAILFLPMPILTGMRLPKKQKIILVATFSAGAFVPVVDVVRIAYLQSAAVNNYLGTTTSGRNVDQSDFPWYASLSFMWSAIEVSIGIVCACVPSLKPLFLRFMPQMIRDNNDITPETSMDHEVERETTVRVSEKNETLTILTNPAAFRRPAVKEYSGEDDGDNMGFLNMLAGPDDDAPGAGGLSRTSTRLSRLSRTSTAGSTASDFDFVKMDKSRNMLKLSNKQSVWPIAVVTFIFFLWGFAYGLLDTLNGQFKIAAQLSETENLGLHAAYFAGYFVGPLTLGRFVLIRYGFKATMIAGLCVYGCGTLVFWPAAVVKAYSAFIVSNFIVAFGLACLEIAANPYTALCGPLEYAEVRLNLSQAIQAVGTVCSLLLAQRVLFNGLATDPRSLVNTQWAYLGISLFVFVLAVVFYYIPLPEATDEQMEEQADKRSAVYRQRVGPYRVVWVTLILGVFAQWCYVGAQEGFGGYSGELMQVLLTRQQLDRLSTNSLSTIGHTLFAVGRFAGTFLNYLIKPRWILLGIFVASTVLTGVQTVAHGNAGVTVSMLIYFFEASIFPIVFAISMRGMGSHTKNAAALMTAAISGGAIVPVVQWAVKRSHDVQYSYCAVAAFFAVGTIFPIYLNLVPAARKQVDPIHETRHRRRRPKMQFRQDSTMSTQSTSAANQFGLAGIIARRMKAKSPQTTFAHVEKSEVPSTPASQESNPWEQVQEPPPVKLKEPEGYVADLAPWDDRESIGGIRHEQGDGHHSGGSDDEITPSPRRSDSPDAEWTEEDDVRDDYHQVLRGL